MLYTKTPHRIIINEAIELAKAFAEKDAYKFVNGLLDKISHKLLPDQPASEETPSEQSSDEPPIFE
jgi:transcription termination factor NusB